jgi:hypothetical protein
MISADMLPTSLYVGVIREMLPDAIDNERDGELYVKQFYESLANDELKEKL